MANVAEGQQTELRVRVGQAVVHRGVSVTPLFPVAEPSRTAS